MLLLLSHFYLGTNLVVIFFMYITKYKLRSARAAVELTKQEAQHLARQLDTLAYYVTSINMILLHIP